MKIWITDKWRESWLVIFKQALPFFEQAVLERETLKDVRRNIHQIFKKEIAYAKKHWLFDEVWVRYENITDEQIEKNIESIKFLCLHIIAMKEQEWYTKTQDVLDFLNKRIEMFSTPFNN